MKKYSEILKKCPLFEGIEEDHMMQMLGCLGAKVEHFDKKQSVITEGEPATNIGIVISGAVQVEQIDYYGNRNILSNIPPAQVFAEAFACAEVRAIPVTVIANEPSEIMLINCNHILHTCENNCGFHQQLIFNLMRDLASKTILFHQRIEITSKRTTRDKLLAYLMLMSKEKNSNRFDIPFDRQELADFLEVERSGLSVEIGKLKREGILDCVKNHFVLY